VNKFTIKGTGDDATAQLKAELDARDAAFNAQLDAMFKSAPAAQPEPAPATPTGPSGRLGDTTSRKPPNRESMHSRLRG
jgi:hypothetical protein